MKESRNILGWFGVKQEERILGDALQHAEATFNTVVSFQEAIKAHISGDKAAKDRAIQKVHEYEHEADLLRSKMVNELSEGLLMPPDREDLLHFVRTLDRIADWTNGAARILGFIEQRLPESISNNLSAATDIIFNAISKLKDGIGALTKNDLKKAVADCEEVGKLEHEADDQKKIVIESIIHAKLEPVTFFLCYQLADYLEGITDKIEDAGDFIKVVAIKSK